LEELKTLLQNNVTFALINDECVYTSEKKGIAPLLKLLSSPENNGLLKDSYVADKVTGRAAALLMLYGGVKELYTDLISTAAKEVLDGKIIYTFKKEVPRINNRDNTGLCPMEEAVMGIDSPETAYKILLDKIKSM
jgi:hypothetical protein